MPVSAASCPGRPAPCCCRRWRGYRGRVFSTSQIYEQVWNDPSLGSENTVAVHIRHLREKIEIDPANPRYIKVVWGLGYKMEKI